MSTFLQKLEPLIENKKHIIWDFNGTILNDVDHTVHVVNSILKEHQLSQISIEDYKRIFRFPVKDYYLDLGFDFSQESFESLCDKYIQRFMADFKEACTLVSGIELSLSTLRKRLDTQSILSAAEQTDLQEIVNQKKISHYFDHIYGIDTHYADSKIAKGKELMAKVGASRAETVIIGDTHHDLEVAKALGIEAVLVSHGHQCVTRLRQFHHQVID